MSRNERILLLDSAHHLARIGQHDTPLFLTKKNYEYSISQIILLASEHNIALHGYCVLPDRIHLLASAGSTPEVLSTYMKALSCRIALHLKRHHDTSGPIWEAHYRSSPVEDAWVLPTLAFIERLPVMHKLSISAYRYPHSSYPVRLGKRDFYGLTGQAEYAKLGNTREERAEAFRVYMKAGLDDEEITTIHTAVMRGKLTGSARFVREVFEKYGIDGENRGPGRPRKNNADRPGKR